MGRNSNFKGARSNFKAMTCSYITTKIILIYFFIIPINFLNSIFAKHTS